MNGGILVTGGAGFIGSHLVRTLLKEGYEVSILDNFSPQIHGTDSELPADISSDVRLVRGDVRDAADWETALENVCAVVHLAAETGTGQSMYEVARYEQVNLGGTANFYQFLTANSKNQIERVVIASSRALYGEGAYLCPNHGLIFPLPRSKEEKYIGIFDPQCPSCGGTCSPSPTPEEAPLRPLSFYGVTKQCQEQTALMFGNALRIPTFALRYQNVFGPGQSLMNPYTGILAVFSNLARAGADIKVFEDGRESRDFVYIDDVVQATVACLETAITGTHAINVGSGVRTSVLEIAHAVNDYLGNRSKITVTKAFREGDIRHALADLKLANSLLGYRPQWCFQDGLARFLAWAEEGAVQENRFQESLEEMKARNLLHGE